MAIYRLPPSRQSSEPFDGYGNGNGNGNGNLAEATMLIGPQNSAGLTGGGWIQWLLLQPVLAILLSLLMVVGGILGYGALAKEEHPDLDIAVALVQTQWPGADPETIERLVTQPIEDEVKVVETIQKLNSASYSGASVVRVEFSAGADLGESLQQLRQAVALAQSQFPPEVEAPVVKQHSINNEPILMLALAGQGDPALLSQTAEQLQQRLERLPGVNQVILGGDRLEVIQIQLDPLRLAQLGVSPQSVAQAIRQANQDVPLDEFEGDVLGGQLRFYGQFRQLADLRSLPVARLGNGSGQSNLEASAAERIVRLDQVATVTRELNPADSLVSVSQGGAAYEPVVTLQLTRAPGQDSLAVIEAALGEIEAQKATATWPQTLDVQVIFNDAEQIWAELTGLGQNVGQAAIAVFAVLMLTLSWREGLIAGLAIPLTFLGTLALLWLGGQTLNSIVLVGLVIALGLLVDVFILIMEGMHGALVEEGLSFDQALLQTVRHYALPTLAGQLTTILAMAPLMAIRGTMGHFIRILPITVIICLGLSFLIAFFIALPLSRYLLLPGLLPGNRASAKGLAGNLTRRKSPMDRLSANAAQHLSNWSRRWVLRSRATALAWTGGALALFGVSLLLIGQVSVEFFPQPDGRLASINLELEPTTTRLEAEAVADEFGELLRGKPYFETVIKDVGQRSELVGSNRLSPSLGNYFVGFSAVFWPKGEVNGSGGELGRDRYSFEYLDELRTELEARLVNYPGARLVITGEQTTQAADPIQIELRGDRLEMLRQLSGEVQLALRDIEGIREVRDDLGALLPDLKLLPKREALDFYGLTAADLAQQARYYTSSTDVGDFIPSGEGESLGMLLSTAWPSRQGQVGGPTHPDELLTMRFFGRDASRPPVPAAAVVELVRGETPLSITHDEGQRQVTVLAKVGEGRTVGQAMAILEPKLQQMQRSWLAGYGYHLGGEVEDQAETFASAGRAFAIAVLLVFSVLVLQLQSFRQPLIILLSVPFALIGVIWGFYWFKIAFSFAAFVGVIAMVGIVVNDAIVMVDTINRRRREGLRLREAALEGIRDRFRPILTTSVTTVVGLVPLALTNPTWMPLASAIMFGLVAATVTALVIIPCLYVLLSPDWGREGRSLGLGE